MKDKNEIVIEIGDTVQAPEPNDSDTYLYEFTGAVQGFHDKFVTVRDGEDECFDIEPERLEITNE